MSVPGIPGMPQSGMSARLARHGRFWVYVVRCRDGTYYTGYTNDLPERIRLHNAGSGAKYVRGKGPVRVVYAKMYRYYKWAVSAERRVKQLTRTQKHALIRASAHRLRKV